MRSADTSRWLRQFDEIGYLPPNWNLPRGFPIRLFIPAYTPLGFQRFRDVLWAQSPQSHLDQDQYHR